MKRHVLVMVTAGTALIFGCVALAEAPSDDSAAALEKARAELATVERIVAEQSVPTEEVEAKLREARRRLLAEEAWAARQAAVSAEESKVIADKALASKTAQVKAAHEKVAAAVKAAEQATAEKAAAEKALEAIPEAETEKRAEATKVLEQKTANAKKADEAVVAANQATEKSAAEKTAAESSVAEKTDSLAKALDAAALAHAEAIGGLKPITSDQWDYAKARHLLFRAGFGGSPEEVAKAGRYGAAQSSRLSGRVPPASAGQHRAGSDIYSWERPLAYESRLHLEAQNRLTQVDGKRNVDQHASMVRWWVQRLLESPRPLEEKLVLFWHDHFASSYRTLGEAYLMYQQNQFFRRYADNFDALLHGIVQDPAMIRYLNNDENVKGNNNENFGRELLELFSLGEENMCRTRTGRIHGAGRARWKHARLDRCRLRTLLGAVSLRT